MRLLQLIQLTDPVLIAEAIRSRDMDKAGSLGASGLNKFSSPHNLPNLLTSTTNERWKAVR